MQERASRMPKPPVKVYAVQEAIDKGDAELESQLLGELQKWVNTDITAEWIPEVENTIHNLETVKSKVKSPSGRYVLDKTLASYKIAQILKERLKVIKKEEPNRTTNPNAEVAKASKAKTAKKKAGEDIAKVEEAMKAEKAKRELKTKEDIEKRLAEIREEYEADKEGRDIQTQADAMVELYGGYANAPKDVKAKIDAQVAKLSARRQELAAEERELEKKLATLAKEQTSTTLDTRTEGQKEDGGYSDNSANSEAVEPYLKTDAELTEGEQKGIEYEINRLADGFGLKPSQLRGVEVKHNADNTAIMVATEWSEGASTARVVELIADNGTNAPDRIWQAYVDGKPASKLMVDEDVNAKDMEDLFDERGLLREPTIEDFLKRRGIEFSMADRDKAIGEARMRLEEEGVESDASGSVRFSVRYLPNEKQRKEIIDGVVAVAGVSERKAKQWLESELSLANVMTGVEGIALDYYADDRYNAIKKNSDYPQGTVDFSNICRKRKDFTNIYKQLQAENPNRVFSAEDLETIRQTMIEDGLEVACGLCYVEDRRQLMGEIADSFIKNLKEGTLKPKIQEALKGDTYVPTVAELLEPAGARTLYDAHPSVFEAFTMFNNARGMQSARLFEGYAEYKREILGWNKAKVKSVNDNGGLRIFSFSDFEATHLIDLVQVILDASSKGVMIQGYTKVPEFARAIRNTGIKLNRSLIPLGDGVKEVNGKLVLVYDPVEGIDVNDRNFLNEEDNPNVGNIVIGVNDEQIKIAMADPFIDYIIPFHSNIKKDILAKKKIGNWTNYKDSQREKNAATGRAADNGVNVYTDVLNAAEAEGKPIKNAKQFVEKFFAVCEERGLTPRFAQFLDKGKNGKYVYTKGYEKLLVDFKMFDKNGKILPQQPVKPIFDNAFNAEIINNYVEGSKTDKNLEPTMAKLRERLNLNGTDPDKGSKRFRVEEDDENLVGLHNLTEANLAHAKKMGGIANPSMAVVNRDIATLDNFGDITLIASRALIDKKSGKNAGTWGADAYSPRYPRVEYQLSDKASKELRERGEQAGLEPHDISYLEQEIESNGKRYLVGDRKIQKLYDTEGKNGESISEYVDRLYDSLDITERLFKGYTWAGGRRYAKHTLENVSRMMKAEGRAGAEGNFGMGSVRAKLTPIFKNIAQIKKAKNRIVSHEEFEKAKESLETRFYELTNLVSESKFDFAAADRLGEAMLSRNPKEYLKQEYDFEITDEDSQKIKTLAADLSVMPTEYFETKFERPVMLEEFAKAVIPNDATAKTRQILVNAGLEVVEYNPNEKGDRLRAVREASERGGVRFSVEDSGDKKEKHSVIEPQDLTTIVVSTKNADAKIISNKNKAKENLNKLSYEFKNKIKTRGFLSSLKESIAGQRLVEQSSYFDFNTPNSEITLRISNHNAKGENFDGDREAISVVIKSERTKNTFEEGKNLTEFVYFKERIAKADGNTLSQIAESIKDLLDTGVYVDKSGLAEINPDSMRFRVEEDDDYSGEGGVRFAVVEDEELIKRLDADEKVIGYRNVVLNEDGTFESPMANSLRSTDRKAKEKTGGFELNKWERSEERPHLVDKNGKITLVKPDGKAVEKVDYNPYIHNRLNMVNKQFKQAWERPNLVYIKTEIPLSDLESGYHAEKAKLPVGEHKWNGGNLILSRYDKPVEICDWNDVADDWQASFKKEGINFDIIPPALLPILEERGMKIIRPHKNMGDACNKAYADWAEARGIDTKGFWAEVAKETEEAEQAKAKKQAKAKSKKAEGGVRFRFIGEQGAKSMDKKEGTTARMDNLAVAKKMLDEYSYKEVKMATGWEKGMDGKWRYETPDFEQFDINGNLKFVQRHPDYARYRELVKKNHKAMLLNQDPLTEAEQAELDKLKAKWGGMFGKMDNVTTLDAYVQDDDLFNAYPELKSIRVKLTDELPKGTRGRFVRREADDILILDPEEIQGTIYLNSRYPLREVESTLIHEIQHVIQHIEGFAKGGNSEMINEEEQRKYEDAVEFTKERIESHRQLIHEYMEQQGEISDKMNDWYNRHGDEAEFDAEMRALGEKWDAIDKKIDGIRKRIKEDEQWLEDHNKKDFRLGYEGYRALAGEVEARNVQKRRGMTPEERRNSLAEETEDVKRGQQIVVGAKDSGYSESLAEEQKGGVRFNIDAEEDYTPVWNEGESFAEANDRIRRKKTVLDIQLKQMERKRALGKSYDADKLEQLRAELEEVKAQIRYLEVGAPKPELAEGESETDASYVAKMNAWHDAMAEWNSKKYGEDAMLDNLLREASGAKADEDVTDEEFKQGLKDEEEKANLSVKEMKGLVKEQIRERRRGIEVSNWQDEMTIYDIKKRTTEEQRKLIPHILEGTYNDPQHRKDKRYADYLAQTGKTDVSSAEWSERKELLNDPNNVENTAITMNQHGLKESDIVEYAVDSDAEILVTGDNLNALIRFPNGDIYTLRKYGVQYLLHIHPEAKQNTMTAEDAELLGMFLRGEAEQYVPQGLREYVEKKEYDEGNTLEVVNEIREWYAEAWSQLEAEGMVYKKEAIEDYVTHIWDLKKSSPTAVTTMQKFLAATAPKALKDINNYVATNTPYVKERAIGSIRDGEAFGLVPKYEDITDIMRDYGHRMNEARENRRLVNFVKGLRVNGMEAIKEEGGRSGGLYIPIKNEALRGYEVHRDVKPVLDVIFGEYHTTDNLFLQKLGHVYDAWGGLLKKLNLSLSFFHHGALSETAIAMTNPFYAGKTIFKNILWDAAFKGDVIKWAKTKGDNSETPAYNDVELTKDAVSHFVQLGATSDYATKEVQAITAKFAEWAEGKVGAEKLATVLDFCNKGMDKILWDYLHDGLKIYGYKKLSTEIRAKAEKEGWDEEVLNRALDEAGQLINDTYGGQHWDLLGVSPNALKWARRAFLSPDWTLSTLRQALAPFGFGQMYDDEKFWKKWFKNDPVADVRKRYGRAFWVTAALFFGGIMNGLNAYYRMKDEDEEKKKAEEIRKTRPEYKSPYELAYPDGMKWWDYTMLGNTQGHETHLFGGRYKDGKEQYVRWGKQFRELPELFFGRDGLSFPQPMIDKITGKLNPMINLMSNLSSGYSLNGFQNDFMRDTRGWDREWARLQVLIAAHLSYSIPTDGEKEFKMIDLVMPSTKGFSNWKGIDRFKTAILAGDMDFCDKVYDACVKNGLHADELLDVAIKQIEVDAKRAMVEGVEDLSDAVAQHDKETNPVRKQLLANYIKKQMSAQDYEEITKEEMREKAYLAINGGVSDKNIKLYDKLCNSNDVIEDWRITKGKAGLKKYVDDLKALKEETDDTELIAKYVADNAKYLNQYKQLDKVQGVITSLKKRLGEGKDAEVMAQIREVRKKAFTAKGQEYGKKKKAKAKKEKPAKPIADYGKELSWSESEE